MSQTLTETSVAVKDPTNQDWPHAFLLGLAVFGVWMQLIAKLTTDWSTNQQFEFGPFVPFFIAVLVFQRWSDRPLAAKNIPNALLGLIAVALLVFLLPLRIVQEANPDWRPLNWVHASVVVGLSLTVAGAMGGRSWMRHFGVPLLLIFFAIPWPLAMEQGVIQFLSRGVTAVTTELLNFCGIPAFRRGNVIEVSSGLIGVNQACTGIRSLAGTLMAAAFFGEFYRLRWGWRGALLVGGVILAFGLNLVRAFILGLLQEEYGGETFQAWHDRTGLMIFAISFGILWAVAAFLVRKNRPPIDANSGNWRRTFLQVSARFSIWLLAAIILWLGAVELATGAWYKIRERELAPSAAWKMDWPPLSSSFRFDTVPTEVMSILRYSEGATGVISDPGHPKWQIYYLRWLPGRTSAQLAVMHRPEICLPAAGLRYVSEASELTVDVSGLQLPFHGSIFDDQGKQLFVYRCLWEDKMLIGALRDRNFDMSVVGRLKGAWHGRRNLGQRLLQICIGGAGSESEAREEMQRRLPHLIIGNI